MNLKASIEAYYQEDISTLDEHVNQNKGAS